MRPFLFFLFVAFLTLQGFAQSDTLVNKSYEELREFVIKNLASDLDLALESAKQYKSKAIVDGDVEKQISGLELVGLVYRYMPNVEGYSQAYDEAKGLAESYHLEKDIKRLYSTTALGYYYMGDWGRSLESYDRTLINCTSRE